MKRIKKLVAFTLAETLTVMGIIGIVAALTVPNLNASTGEKEKVVKVKKIYRDLNEAFNRATAIYGPVHKWQFSGSGGQEEAELFAGRMLEFLKVSKDCGTGTNTDCLFRDKYLYLNSTTFPLEFNKLSEVYKIITSDGMSVAFHPTATRDWDDHSEGVGIDIYVDIDGPNKGAHTFGKDMFLFYVTKDYGLIPEFSTLKTDDTNLKFWCFERGKCAGWVIETGNMDYLKASNGTCPNGTVLSWTNTSCK